MIGKSKNVRRKRLKCQKRGTIELTGGRKTVIYRWCVHLAKVSKSLEIIQTRGKGAGESLKKDLEGQPHNHPIIRGVGLRKRQTAH